MIAKALSVVTAVSCFAMSTASAADGKWTFGTEDRGHPQLVYSENGKSIFSVGCGHAFAVHAVYPGPPKKEGEKAAITIASGRMKKTLRGEISSNYDEDPPGSTHFMQVDLGYARQDPALYGRAWKKMERRLLDLIDSGRPLRISAEGRSYTLPAVDARGWEARFKAIC
jgi:hypothetical protein